MRDKKTRLVKMRGSSIWVFRQIRSESAIDPTNPLVFIQGILPFQSAPNLNLN